MYFTFSTECITVTYVPGAMNFQLLRIPSSAPISLSIFAVLIMGTLTVAQHGKLIAQR
jgi:hypothetical protein